ncbi:MAG: 2-thiouracil desulfurase family protein [Anaerolineae bacterium]
MTAEFPRPRVVVSKCLGFAACRYNGQTIPDEFVASLRPHVDFVQVCPEVEIGLGVPREPLRVVLAGGRPRLLQPATGRDVTDEMRAFAETFLGALEAVDGFLLKGRSPSCGIQDVKVYPPGEKVAPVGKGVGFFGGAVKERFAGWPVEEEGRLKNFRLREHFLIRLFTLARFRQVRDGGRMGDLVRFHADHKFLLMAYSQAQLRLLGRIVANPEGRPPSEVLAAYEEHLRSALANPARSTSIVNVLLHALGHLREGLSPQEKAYFLDALAQYRAGRLPMSVPVGILRAWVIRFEEPYLSRQHFFAPYPTDLVTITDSGKGRDLD